MQPAPTPDQAAQAVNQALDGLADQTPALAGIIAAFRPLLAGQARVRAALPSLAGGEPKVDPARLAQGLPLAAVEDFLASPALDPAQYLREAAGALLPAMAQGLPALAGDAQALERALAGPALAAVPLMEAVLGGQREELEAWTQRAGLNAAARDFILLQLLKPLLEKRAEALAPALADQAWSHGTCPVCGALPEIGYLQGEGGQRWLRCSLCAHHWRFARTRCPVCDNQEPDQMEYFFVEGRERERVDYCKKCGKYLLAVDVRGLDVQPLWAVAGLGLVHLDLMAQQKGLTPAARTAWNQVK